MKTKLEIFTILPKITINWEIYIHFGKNFYTKVSRKRRLTKTTTQQPLSHLHRQQHHHSWLLSRHISLVFRSLKSESPYHSLGIVCRQSSSFVNNLGIRQILLENIGVPPPPSKWFQGDSYTTCSQDRLAFNQLFQSPQE